MSVIFQVKHRVNLLYVKNLMSCFHKIIEISGNQESIQSKGGVS